MPEVLGIWSLSRYIKGLGDPLRTLQHSNVASGFPALKHILITDCLSGV